MSWILFLVEAVFVSPDPVAISFEIFKIGESEKLKVAPSEISTKSEISADDSACDCVIIKS